MSAYDQKAPEIYEKTFQFAVRIVKLCQHLDGKPGVSRTVAKQILRTSKLEIALKEARETCFWLRLVKATQIVGGDRLSEIQKEADEIKRIIAAIIVSTKRRNKIIVSGALVLGAMSAAIPS